MTALNPPPPSYEESVDQQSTGPYPQQSCIAMTCEQTIHPPLPGRYGEGIGGHVISNPVYPPNPTDFNGEAGEHCGGESGGYDNSNAAYPPFPINSETSNQQMEMTAVQSTDSHSIEVKDATASVLNNPSSNVVQWQPTGPPAQFDDDPCDTCKEIGFCFLLFITIPLWFPVWFCYYVWCSDVD